MRFPYPLPALALCLAVSAFGTEPAHTLWYTQPATHWDEGLPIGNGRLGAMEMGGVGTDRIQLNEGTLTSGEPADDLRSIDIRPDLPKVRQMIHDQQYDQADDFINHHWLGRCQQSYEPLGDLWISMPNQVKPIAYRRWLDLSAGVVGTQWTQDGVTYTREAFASYPDQVIVIKLAANKPGRLTFIAKLDSPHPTARETAFSSDTVEMTGQIPGFLIRRSVESIEKSREENRYPELFNPDGSRKPNTQTTMYADQIGGKGMHFDARLFARSLGGTVVVSQDGIIAVQNANEAILVLSAGTSFNGFDKSPSTQGADPTKYTQHHLEDAVRHTYNELYGRHEVDYKALFDRASLSLPSSRMAMNEPTDIRLKSFAITEDPGLAELLFELGRYLLISGSRQGGQPTNLQGLWNDQVVPPWACSYTVNINTEMNYWPAEATQLSELEDPLFRMLSEVAITGAGTAKNMYGARGWVLHHNTTLWRDSYPVDGNAKAAFWNMAGGWLCSQLWEHYLYSGDKTFLATTAYPLMRGAAAFYSDWLVVADDGTLITPVSTSPENMFMGPDGKAAGTSEGTTMDMTIIRELFTRTIAAEDVLGVDPDLKAELSGKLAKLSPFRVGARGQLQEWRQDFPEVELHHRHMSHLYGLFPGNQITPDLAPALFAAAHKSLELRGDEATGWAMAWRIALWARMQDGDHALAVMRSFIKPARDPMGNQLHGGGLYNSLLDACPPFQIDGNYGFTAGLEEMLIQSHDGCVQLLPALPKAWPQGSVSGLKTRGGFTVSMDWRNGALQRALIYSSLGGVCRIRTPQSMIIRGAAAVPATGEVDNALLRPIDPGAPIIAAGATMEDVHLPRTFTIDVQTRPGQTLLLAPATSATHL